MQLNVCFDQARRVLNEQTIFVVELIFFFSELFLLCQEVFPNQIVPNIATVYCLIRKLRDNNRLSNGKYCVFLLLKIYIFMTSSATLI
jgi:hypothetical protein